MLERVALAELHLQVARGGTQLQVALPLPLGRAVQLDGERDVEQRVTSGLGLNRPQAQRAPVRELDEVEPVLGMQLLKRLKDLLAENQRSGVAAEVADCGPGRRGKVLEHGEYDPFAGQYRGRLAQPLLVVDAAAEEDVDLPAAPSEQPAHEPVVRADPAVADHAGEVGCHEADGPRPLPGPRRGRH